MIGLLPRAPTAIFASPEVKETLRRHRLDNLGDIFQAAAHARPRHAGRAVWSAQLTDDDGPFTAYFKLAWGRPRVWPRMTDIVAGQALQSLVDREWRGIAKLESLGFLVPQRLALLEEGGISRRAAVVVREIEPKLSLSDMIKGGGWSSLPEGEQRRLVLAANEVLVRISAAGFGWRGASCRHFYPAKDAAGGWRMWLIDCEGLHRGRSRNVLERDCEKFLKSFARARADQGTIQLAEECRNQTLAAAG